METDNQKLLNACKEYRAKVDEALEKNKELYERLSTIPDDVWSKADLVEQRLHALAERDELQKKNAKLRVALEDIMTESDEQHIWRMARAALQKEAQP